MGQPIRLRLHQAQADFRHSSAPYRGFVGGRGAGKTFIGAVDLILRAKPGRLYLVAAPTYNMLSDVTMRSFLKVAGPDCLDLIEPGSLKLSPPGLKLRTGAEVIFRSADNPERFRGPNLTGAWLDEASLMALEAFEIVIATLREPGEKCWLSATFTPKGLDHWTYEIFGKGDRPDTALFRAKTTENPFLDPLFYQQVSQQYAARLALQELEGEFITQDGAEWPAEYFNPSIWFNDWPNDLTVKACSLDPSKGKDSKFGDYSAFVQLGRDRQGTLYVDADLLRAPAEFVVQHAVELNRTFRPDVFAIETNQFQELLAAAIAKEGRSSGFPIPVVPMVNTVNKLVRIRRLGPYLAQGAVRFKGGSPGAKLLVQQLRDFPLAGHDDGPDAMELALRAAVDFWNGKQKRKGPTRIVT